MPARERHERARRFLADLGLGELADKRPGAMSGGQQQRVAVARAIASEPEIVLADEPTANLDSKTAEDLLDLMERLNRDRGVTFLFCTHDPRVMARARRAIRLVDGRIASDERTHRVTRVGGARRARAPLRRAARARATSSTTATGSSTSPRP